MKPPALFAVTLREALELAGHSPGPVKRATRNRWGFTLGTGEQRLLITVEPAP